VALDEEHARMLDQAMSGEERQPYAPPMSTWTSESALLATLIDEVRGLRFITLAVNSAQKPQPPMPYPRPRTALDRIRRQERESRHRSLVARMLPHKST
jgi:hypothetical protein